MTEIDKVFRAIGHGALGWEVGVLLGCLVAAFAIAWLIGRRYTSESVWFGRAVIDGLLFPLLALTFTYTASVALGKLQSVPLLRIAVPMLVSLAGIRFLARVFTIVFPNSAMARLIERLFSWLAWIAAVLWILGLLPAVMAEMEAISFAFGKARISLLAIVQGTLSAGAVLVLTLWISAVLERKILRDAVTDLSLRKIANNAIRAVLVLTGLLFVLSAVGVDLTALSVLGGAIGVGLGFGLQKLASNYVSGFVILSERSLRIGDTVRVDNFEGVVSDIKTRYTLIRALNGRESIVPNEKLITERIENLSLADPRVMLSTELTVSNDADVDVVQRILLESAKGTPRVIEDPDVAVRLTRFAPDGLDFALYFWIGDPANGQANVKSDVNLRILKGLREAGISLPYPQRTISMAPQPPSGVH